jgi:hypothetical protein
MSSAKLQARSNYKRTWKSTAHVSICYKSYEKNVRYIHNYSVSRRSWLYSVFFITSKDNGPSRIIGTWLLAVHYVRLPNCPDTSSFLCLSLVCFPLLHNKLSMFQIGLSTVQRSNVNINRIGKNNFY